MKALKIVFRILFIIGVVIISLIAILFAFIELRSLFSLDFLLFNNPIAGFFAYLSRGLFYLSMLGLTIAIVVLHILKRKIHISLQILSFVIFIGSLLSFIFYDFSIALIVMTPCGLLALICAFLDSASEKLKIALNK